ncbi:hypothetical protein L1787_06025 [Acuticoccus sp. M5D2P5]|uniref:hypothetical protein n=1 Tax=Acuticoccus kalidii TaxID=2910977 RepID=UPI001F40E41B|nr:hypothetical protein [Acuticoccus kalidii]MCF3932971.1 hypothetical protein [Acuticoccus kalidii]
MQTDQLHESGLTGADAVQQARQLGMDVDMNRVAHLEEDLIALVNRAAALDLALDGYQWRHDADCNDDDLMALRDLSEKVHRGVQGLIATHVAAFSK